MSGVYQVPPQKRYHTVSHEGKTYNLMVPDSLFDLKTHGLKLKLPRGTSTAVLYDCYYIIKDGLLVLNWLESPYAFVYTGLRKLFLKNVKINGIAAEYFEYECGEGTFNHRFVREYIFQDLDLKINYTGTIKLGWYKNELLRYGDFDKVLQWRFEKGRLVDQSVISDHTS